MNNKIIIHIDFDSFFASVAQQDNPKLRGKPVAVTAHNGRTAIIAASREAKAMGVTSPGRTYDALKKCPNLKFAAADFVRYLEISKKFLRIADSFSPTVELFSIDEVFMDVTDTVRLFGGLPKAVNCIKVRVAKEIGEYITVSVGISHNKLLAKLASGLNKPNGIREITNENIWDIYGKAKLTDICGIGRRIKQRLNVIGIHNLLELRDTKLEKLVSEFGNIEGHFLKDAGQGIGAISVNPYSQKPTVKSVSRNYCLPKNEYDKRIVLQNIFELCEEVALKLRRLGKKSQTIGLGLRGSKSFYAHKTVGEFLDKGSEFYTLCSLFYKNWDLSYVRMISVWAGGLVEADKTPKFLFGNPERAEKLQGVIDKINNRFGDHTIRNGFLLNSEKLTTVPNGFMADKWERTQLAQ